MDIFVLTLLVLVVIFFIVAHLLNLESLLGLGSLSSHFIPIFLLFPFRLFLQVFFPL